MQHEEEPRFLMMLFRTLLRPQKPLIQLRNQRRRRSFKSLPLELHLHQLQRSILLVQLTLLLLNPQSLHLWLVRLPVALRSEVPRIRFQGQVVGLEALAMGMVLARERVKALVHKAAIKEAVTPEAEQAEVVDRSRRHLLEVGEQEELEELAAVGRR